jgi:hypothetical protein
MTGGYRGSRTKHEPIAMARCDSHFLPSGWLFPAPGKHER